MATSEGNTPPTTLSTLCTLIDAVSGLQERVKAARNPQEVVDIAKSLCLEVTPIELRAWSRDLSAPYFPWAGMGHEHRRNFFKGYI